MNNEMNNEMKSEYLPLARKELNILNFVRSFQATDHMILFFNDLKNCRQLLFTFLKAGMDKGEAAVYVVGQEMQKQNPKATDDFSVSLKKYEIFSALKVVNYDEWYIINGKVDIPNIIMSWRKAVNAAKEGGFKGMRVCGEMACFFKNNLADKLLEYEKACDRELGVPMTIMCAYDLDLLNMISEKFFIDLLKTHSHFLFVEPDLGFNFTLEAVDSVLDKVLGGLSKMVLFSSLGNLFGIEKEDIPMRFMDFRVALEKTFGGTTAGLLENMIFRELYFRLKKRSMCNTLEVEK